MSVEAWTAFIDSLIDYSVPLVWAGVLGWLLRGASDARRARREHR